MKSSTRWALTPLAIIAAFVAAMLLAIPLNYATHAILWSTGHHMPGKNFLIVAMTLDGALAAFLVVLAGALAAPRKRLLTAVIIFVAGAVLAWAEIGEMYSPTGPARVWSPIIGTYCGGLLGILLIAIKERKRSNQAVEGMAPR